MARREVLFAEVIKMSYSLCIKNIAVIPGHLLMLKQRRNHAQSIVQVILCQEIIVNELNCIKIRE